MLFEATVESKRLKAGHRGDDRLRFGERALESRFLACDHVEDCMLKNHPDILPRASHQPERGR